LGFKNLRLKAVMAGLEITLDTLAKEIGVAKGSLSRKINGKRKFTEPEIEAVCRFLNKEPTEIFFDSMLSNEQQNKKLKGA